MEIGKDDLDFEELRQVLQDTMHEVREFNRMIKANCEMLTRLLQIEKEGAPLNLNAQNADNARGQSLSIMQTAQMLSARLDLIDFETNPSSFSSEPRVSTSVYGKFDKTRKMLLPRAKHKSVWLKLEGRSYRKTDLYPVFDILPFLLIENAIKYAPASGEVSVAVVEYTKLIEVTIESLGPTLTELELSRICEKHFRGEQAKKTGEKGSGFGLYFAQFIANLNSLELKFSSAKEATIYNGVRYSQFRVTLRVPI